MSHELHPFSHFMRADYIWRRFHRTTRVFSVAWAAELVPNDNALCARLVKAVQNVPERQLVSANLEWEASIAALQEWQSQGAGAGFLSFLFNVSTGFFPTLLALDKPLAQRMIADFQQQCRAVFPTQIALPFPPSTPSHQEKVA